MWLLGLRFGMFAAAVDRLVVAPFKGQRTASGFVPLHMLIPLLINGVWGIGLGVVLPLLAARRSAARA